MISVQVDFRPALPADEPFLFELYASTRLEEIAAWGWEDAQRQAFLSMQFNARQRQYSAKAMNASHQIILRAGQPVGHIWIDHRPGEFALMDIALLPEQRGAGIGTALIQRLQAEAAQAGMPICLHVLKTNRASRLYSRLGFQVSREDEIYAEMVWKPAIL
jgi:ribosomal protein S18 acetylase RimI-like enzyme